ncbi:hypothetical protein GUJ93_ZPchr0010g9253 [Zizania palustris]|uniref:Uncharacterized protein n=1 Tax=Zizania palustris TaxID=103762 RepID=A0A8J6BFL2_ZIZPA|nr:hypothetical protein GUJ93_ZPchr0010g9253 [Zizania palustris]
MERGCLSTKSPPFKPPAKKVTINQGIQYLEAIKDTFPHDPETYQIFVGVMRDYKSKRIDIERVVFRISMLFKGHKNLLRGFNKFLPNDMKTVKLN